MGWMRIITPTFMVAADGRRSNPNSEIGMGGTGYQPVLPGPGRWPRLLGDGVAAISEFRLKDFRHPFLQNSDVLAHAILFRQLSQPARGFRQILEGQLERPKMHGHQPFRPQVLKHF